MTKEGQDRLWRAVDTCRHCLKNIAFYRAGWRMGQYRASGVFWQNANNAFFGLAISEWCKLFADGKGRHHWSLLVENRKRFEWELFKRVRKSEAQFKDYLKMAKGARDKAVAPLDEHTAMQMPNLRTARTSVAYFHDYLLHLPNAIRSAADEENLAAASLYRGWYRVARLEYRSAAARSRHGSR
jgi:hypothetical protein